jgi:hypothetical protein
MGKERQTFRFIETPHPPSLPTSYSLRNKNERGVPGKKGEERRELENERDRHSSLLMIAISYAIAFVYAVIPSFLL